MFSRQKMFAALGLLIFGIGTGCLGKTDGSAAPSTGTGPINGTYILASMSCNGSSGSFLGTGESGKYVVISNSTGSFITSFTSGCVNTEGNVYTYPTSSTFTMQKVNRVCSGTSCSGSECTADSSTSTALDWSYTLSGTLLTLTRTSAGNDGCSAGQATVYTANKQ